MGSPKQSKTTHKVRSNISNLESAIDHAIFNECVKANFEIDSIEIAKALTRVLNNLFDLEVKELMNKNNKENEENQDKKH